MITTNKSGFFAVVKIRHEQWQNWESMPMFLEVPFSMPMSMPMFRLEGFSMAMPMSILFQVLFSMPMSMAMSDALTQCQ